MRGKQKKQQEQQEQPEQPAHSEARAGAGLERKRITPVQIQQKEFRLAVRGYNERDVDAFLDEVTEEVARLHAENKRLREDMGAQGTTRLDTGAAAEADEILRQAREEAARIVAEAESRAAAVAAAVVAQRTAGPGSFASSKNFINAFLARERDFLQGLAGLIQSHAESVKEDIRISRDQAKSGTNRPPSFDPPEGASPVPSTAGPVHGGGEGAESAGGQGGGGAGAASDERRTEPWRSAGLGPDTPMGSGGAGTAATRAEHATGAGAVGTSTIAPQSPPDQSEERGKAVLDLTKADEEPPPQDVAARQDSRQYGQTEEEDQTSDRSLRELFWGED